MPAAATVRTGAAVDVGSRVPWIVAAIRSIDRSLAGCWGQPFCWPAGPRQLGGDRRHGGRRDLGLSFAPIDATRRILVAVGPAYHVGESSYLVRADSPYRQAGDLHRPGVVIMGVAGTATLRSSEQAAAGATVIGTATLPEATALFTAGRCDALALGRLALDDLAARMPGTRVTEGNFHVAETAVIVPKGNPAALAAASELMRRMKRDGIVAASFRRHGMADAVTPGES